MAGERARAQEGESIVKCLVCDDDGGDGLGASFTFTDLHGEGACVRCGTPYALPGYWSATGKPNGLGTYLNYLASALHEALAGETPKPDAALLALLGRLHVVAVVTDSVAVNGGHQTEGALTLAVELVEGLL